MSDYFDRIERQLVHRVEAGMPAGRRFSLGLGHLAVAASLCVVLAVGAVFIGIGGSGPRGAPTGARVIRILFSASSLDPRAALGPSMDRSVGVLRRRLNSVFRRAQVSRTGSDLVVVVPNTTGVSRERILALTVPGQLRFYDWEANVFTQNGQTVASRLPRQDPAAMELSQGTGGASPGEPGAGSMPLFRAVRLAAKRPPLNTLNGSRSGPEYYLFEAPRSLACKSAASDHHDPALADTHCLLSGPESTPQALNVGLPAGVRASDGQRLEVPHGTVVVQAANQTPTPKQIPVSASTAQFYVLTDNPSLSGADIIKPQQSTDQSGAPDVQFGFSSTAAKRFKNVTAQIAHRGSVVSRPGQALNQHFAIALDNKLIAVPSIDFKSYPDGITGDTGADITGAFTTQTARTLATLLRYGPLSVSLTAV